MRWAIHENNGGNSVKDRFDEQDRFLNDIKTTLDETSARVTALEEAQNTPTGFLQLFRR